MAYTTWETDTDRMSTGGCTALEALARTLKGRHCVQGSREGTDDDDDYFHSEAELPCIPEVPEGLKSESDSIDLDELPCIVPEDLVLQNGPVRASSSGFDEPQLPASQSHSSAPRRLAAAAASISRSAQLTLVRLYAKDKRQKAIEAERILGRDGLHM